ncbi:hypothetical protein [Bremerella sp. P1]|uniref:hypothetical protein n=1 Tax=Bremerella sp. P1 TaxID=3026424 RepID=UPI002367E1E6|nr:hypothetical protein [Bremerella sp. P1]WDI44955.1 hypothetical protein PSR63_13510 [Bremerella sp. P1]
MIRILLWTFLVLGAIWIATSMVLPTPGPASQREVTVVWRRTDQGWLRAESWLVEKDYLYQEPKPPLYPMTLLPIIVTLSVGALILGQPKG